MWETIKTYFNTLEERPFERSVIIVGGLLLLWIIEGAIPLLTMRYKKTKLRHAGVNLAFTAFHLVIHTGLALVIIMISDWCRDNEFGVVYWVKASLPVTILISLLMLDFFGGWLAHIVEHKIKFLWRFHVVHHADNNVDVTTALRHHPVESIVRGLFFFMGVFISGAPMYGVMIFQTFLVLAAQITHANISLPAWFDKAVSYIFVSPNMHKVHHHWKQPFTDSNYGGIFAIWDRLLGTFKKLDPKDVRYGLDRYYPNDKDEDIGLLLKKPFQQLDS